LEERGAPQDRDHRHKAGDDWEVVVTLEGEVKGCGSSGVVHHPPADVITPCAVMAGLDPAIPIR
jgi:hypothetical protein